jgi:hypothetical protein
VMQWNAAKKCLGVERALQYPPRDVSTIVYSRWQMGAERPHMFKRISIQTSATNRVRAILVATALLAALHILFSSQRPTVPYYGTGASSGNPPDI